MPEKPLSKRITGKTIRGKLVNTLKENQGRVIDVNVNGVAYKFGDGVIGDIPIEVVEAIKDAVEWVIPKKNKDINIDKGEVHKKIPVRKYEFFPDYSIPKTDIEETMEELKEDNDILDELKV